MQGSQPGGTPPVIIGLNTCVQHVPKRWTQAQLQDFLHQHSIIFSVARKKPEWSYAFVTFGDAAERRAATVALGRLAPNGHARLVVRDATHSAQKGRELPADLSQADIRDVVCPLWRLPYSVQLARKHQRVADALQAITKKVRKALPRTAWLPAWVREARELSGLCTPLVGILRAPQRDGYRNKCEFSIGSDAAGRPTVGFLLGSYKEGVIAVAPPAGPDGVRCPHISAAAAAAAAALQAFLRTRSSLPVWDKRRNQGFWRMLTVREGRTHTFFPGTTGHAESAQGAPVPLLELDWRRWLVEVPIQGTPDFDEANEEEPPPPEHLMLVVQVDPTAGAELAVHAECAALRAFLEAELAEVRPRLLLQHHSGVSNMAPPDAPLLPFPCAGDAPREPQAGALADGQGPDQQAESCSVIHDALGDLTFQISPGSFFQVNSPAAAVLYRLVGAWAAPSCDAAVLDICCGTGTIAITLARQVRSVVGVDNVRAAITNAAANAALNRIANAEWVCGKAEDVLAGILARAAAPQFPEIPANAQGKCVGPAEASAGHAEDGMGATRAGLDGGGKQPSGALQGGAKPAVAKPQGITCADAPPCPSADAGLEPSLPHPGAAGSQQCSKALPADSQAQDLAPNPGPASQQCCVKSPADSRVAQDVPAAALVAVVDPPRAGLHARLIHALLHCSALRRLVYVSCNPDTLAANAAALCTPNPSAPKPRLGQHLEAGEWSDSESGAAAQGKAEPGALAAALGYVPFRPVKAMAVDLFPHTAHCEAVLLLER